MFRLMLKQYSRALKMARVLVLLVVALTAVAAAPGTEPERIIGGSATTIDEYPYAAALLYAFNMLFFSQACGGTIITSRSVLTAAHCFHYNLSSQWRMRVGSTFSSSGGTVINVNSIIRHPNYSTLGSTDNDIAILRTSSAIVYSNVVQPASIAGSTYNLLDNEEVWAIGWGRTTVGGLRSEQLRHVQIWTVNQAVCVERYATVRDTVTDNMLCAGWLDVGGRDQCQGDSGGPLLHHNVVVGICSWGRSCADPFFPGVNTRVSRYTAWVQANA